MIKISTSGSHLYLRILFQAEICTDASLVFIVSYSSSILNDVGRDFHVYDYKNMEIANKSYFEMLSVRCSR